MDTEKVIISRDVMFYESMFPFQATKGQVTKENMLPLLIGDNSWQEPDTIDSGEDNGNEEVHDQSTILNDEPREENNPWRQSTR